MTIWEYDFRTDKTKRMFIWLVWGILIDGKWELRGSASTLAIAKAQSKMIRGDAYPDKRIRRVHIEKVEVDHLYGASMLSVDVTPQIEEMRRKTRQAIKVAEEELEKYIENRRKRAQDAGILTQMEKEMLMSLRGRTFKARDCCNAPSSKKGTKKGTLEIYLVEVKEDISKV